MDTMDHTDSHASGVYPNPPTIKRRTRSTNQSPDTDRGRDARQDDHDHAAAGVPLGPGDRAPDWYMNRFSHEFGGFNAQLQGDNNGLFDIAENSSGGGSDADGNTEAKGLLAGSSRSRRRRRRRQLRDGE